jgi:hypothetical protein
MLTMYVFYPLHLCAKARMVNPKVDLCREHRLAHAGLGLLE